jgi:hypothetical protein
LVNLALGLPATLESEVNLRIYTGILADASGDAPSHDDPPMRKSYLVGRAIVPGRIPKEMGRYL